MGRRAQRSISCASILLVVGVAVCLCEADASPWSREPGRLFISTQTDFFLAKSSDVSLERYDNRAYFEYGLARGTMIGAKLSHSASTFGSEEESTFSSGFSEIEGFAQHEILRGERDVLSLRLAGGAPAKGSAGRADRAGHDVDLELRALYGRTLALRPLKIFAAVETGYRRRFGNDADEIRSDFLLGAEPARRTLVLLEVFSTLSLRNEKLNGADYDVMKIQPSIIWRASRHWSLQAGAVHELAGRNLLLGNAVFFGFWALF
ncbi:MAG: hypothetical protein AB7P23_00585 [Amphiplicatus sp.]